jgi:hypothetical protein
MHQGHDAGYMPYRSLKAHLLASSHICDATIDTGHLGACRYCCLPAGLAPEFTAVLQVGVTWVLDVACSSCRLISCRLLCVTSQTTHRRCRNHLYGTMVAIFLAREYLQRHCNTVRVWLPA